MPASQALADAKANHKIARTLKRPADRAEAYRRAEHYYTLANCPHHAQLCRDMIKTVQPR